MTNPFVTKARKPNPFAAKIAASNNHVDVEKPNPYINKAKGRPKLEDFIGAQTKGFLSPGSEKADFVRAGIKFHNPRDQGDYWTVDATNGDMTFTFHNRFSAWFLDMGGGNLREPTREVVFGLQDRYIAELRRIGAELPFSYRTVEDKKASKPKPKKKANPWGKKIKEKIKPTKQKDNPFKAKTQRNRRRR